MAYFVEFDEANKIVRLVWEGNITDDVYLEGVAAGIKFLASHPGVRGISDFSKATMIDMSSKAIEQVALVSIKGVQDSTVVTVAPENFKFGLSRMFEMLADKTLPHHHSVRTIEGAYELLGVTDPKFERISMEL